MCVSVASVEWCWTTVGVQNPMDTIVEPALVVSAPPQGQEVGVALSESALDPEMTRAEGAFLKSL